MDENCIEEFFQEVEKAKRYCVEHGIDWDAIETGYKPKVMEYTAFGLA